MVKKPIAIVWDNEAKRSVLKKLQGFKEQQEIGYEISKEQKEILDSMLEK